MKNLLPVKLLQHKKFFLITSIILGIFLVVSYGIFFFYNDHIQSEKTSAIKNVETTKTKLRKIEQELKTVTSEDQFVKNKKLEQEIADIKKTYMQAMKIYEQMQNTTLTVKTKQELDKLFALSLSQLADKNYTSASATLNLLTKQIEKETQSSNIVQNAPVNNTAPVSGYSRQSVKTDVGTYTLDIVAGDLSSTRVAVDIASDGDCKDNCPVLSLGDYVSRSGAYAGVNGSYFCPASYPSCAGKTNSFDTLLMNKNKKYFNSDNNVYSTVPVAVFYGTTARFIPRSLDWGRDTGVDAVIANQPLILLDGNITFGGDGDPKKGSKGSRSFIGSKGSTVYIGVVHNVTVGEMAIVLKALGLQNALNLDSGGSTALWSGGYKVGPGRNIPNAVLFIRK